MMRYASILALAMAPLAAAAEPREFDVVVYGATPGGVMAAIQATRMGKTSLLIEPGRHVGGMTSGGLGATDIGNKGAIGGLAREFYQRVHTHYNDDSAWTHENRADFRGSGHARGEDTAWTFEPHVAERIFRAMLNQARVTFVPGQRLDLKNGVKMEGTRIAAIVMESGQVYRGRMFIDATYEGDLMAKAGASYHVGREANATYGETLNGVQVRNARHHQFIKKVDPFIRPGDPTSGLLPRIHAGPVGTDGEGDHRVQAYNFRLCATDVAANRRPWPKPAQYDERQYEILLRNFAAGDLRLPWNPLLMPNRKTDANNNFAFSTDNIGANYDYPEGDYATRERILREHLDYTQGLMWTLANHPRVPESVKKHYSTWSLARDEFSDTDQWPHQLYVREARRLIGEYVMIEANCRGTRTAEDSVGLAAYTMDSHNVQRYVTAGGEVRNEGDVQVGGFPPYPISYRSLLPKPAQCGNLLVPVCLSASHIAYGSIRMEPVFMVLGQSAATAAVLAIDAGVEIQQVKYPNLRERLLKDRQILVWERRRPVGAIDAATLGGIVVDDTDARREGFGAFSNAIGPFVGDGYRHDGGMKDGKQMATYNAMIPAEGQYDVRLSYSANPNRATNVPVTVTHADGKTRVTVNQRKHPSIDKAFVSIGKYRYLKGSYAAVQVSNAGVDGHVIIDAVQWMPVKD